MARRIPDEVIDEIRSANDIVDVISERIQVKKAGRNYRALCPFHQEKSPSFNINPERQIYHCFGCGAGGNVITFLMEHDKLSFPDAMRELADRAGIRLPESGSGAGLADDEDPIYGANEFAASYFAKALRSQGGADALGYLNGRGLTNETIESFGLGFAVPGWDGLLRAAAKAGFRPQTLEEAGLVVARESGGHYDRFRDRLLFPLKVSAGRTVGFGGRAMGDAEPKYLNSPETRVYHKGRYLYGLREARPAIRVAREVILVEGYMDLLSLYQGGFQNAVASSGTALTREQAKTIARYVDKVFIAYDGDAAGIAAATRAAEELIRFGLKVRVASFPEGADPDSFLREKGPDALRDVLSASLDFIDFLVAQSPAGSPDEREQAARRLVGIVARVEDPIVADLMLEKVADALGIRRAAIVRAYAALKGEGGATRSGATGTPGRPSGRGGDAPPIEEAALAAQKGLLSLLVCGGEAAARVRASVSPSDFANAPARALAELMWGEDEADVAALLSRVKDRDEAALLSELAVLAPSHRDGARLCDDYIRTIQRSRIEERIRSLDREIETAEMTRSDERLLTLAAERQDLALRLRELTAGN
ncbi:MAG: DNA primase [Candidatus Eisenbacteria bacterium]